MKYLDLVFDGPPGPEGGRFIEAERDGVSVDVGQWVERADGTWVLQINEPAAPHCETCICGRRAPVQSDDGRGPGTIAWAEHLEIWSWYAKRYGTGQSAERLAQRGGFGYSEIVALTGHEPTTWTPR